MREMLFRGKDFSGALNSSCTTTPNCWKHRNAEHTI